MYTGHLIFLFSNSLDFLVLLCLSQSPNNKSINKQKKQKKKIANLFFSLHFFFLASLPRDIQKDPNPNEYPSMRVL